MRAKLVAIALVVVVAAAAPAHADSEEDRALGHLERGVAAYRKGEFRRAHEELAAAHGLVPDRANPFRWLALTEVQLGDCPAALEHIDGFLSRVPPEDPRVAEMTRWRELCSRTGVLRVDSSPQTVTLRIDGAIVGTTPYQSLSMRTGDHELVAERAGYRSARRTIAIVAGEELDVRLTLSPSERAITERWWFWTAIGVGALVVAGGVFYATTRSDETLLPPIHCDGTGCMP